ncbi:MAG: hypothetical protein HLUCCA05_08990 [Roseibaca calidilacus]|uniref:Uncharacterized protein n=1 Tax=Roseibaca calidilacus TaxID=1666912 RepID=A0A0P7YQ53_9RHOB|nr:MAG: hypothetical protein HLUCCA05_08990 [Roseibaca calidilacus]
MCQSAPLRCRMRALPCQPSGGQGMGLGASCPAASSTLRAGPQAQGPPLALALASLARGLEPGPATRAAQYLVPGPWQIPVLAQARQLPVPARQPVRWSQPPWVPVRVQARPGAVRFGVQDLLAGLPGWTMPGCRICPERLAARQQRSRQSQARPLRCPKAPLSDHLAVSCHLRPRPLHYLVFPIITRALQCIGVGMLDLGASAGACRGTICPFAPERRAHAAADR